MDEKHRLLLADDHPLIRAGLRAGIEDEQDIEVVGEAADGHGARALCMELRPDVLLLDLSMPGPPAAENVRYLRQCCPDTAIVILSAHKRPDFVHGLVRAGISGYVLKDEPIEQLAEAVRTVCDGGVWFSPAVVGTVARHEKLQASLDLTQREVQVLGALARGWGNRRMAEHFSLSEQTVRNYLSHVYEKLQVGSRAEAVIWALEHGFSGEVD